MRVRKFLNLTQQSGPHRWRKLILRITVPKTGYSNLRSTLNSHNKKDSGKRRLSRSKSQLAKHKVWKSTNTHWWCRRVWTKEHNKLNCLCLNRTDRRCCTNWKEVPMNHRSKALLTSHLKRRRLKCSKFRSPIGWRTNNASMSRGSWRMMTHRLWLKAEMLLILTERKQKIKK